MSTRRANLHSIHFVKANGLDLKGNFHDNVVRILRELPNEVCLVCARKPTGPSPLRGTIVNNVDTGKSEKAFASRVSFKSTIQIILTTS